MSELMKNGSKKNADEELRERILAKLASCRTLARIRLRVGVLYGIVHLAGEVPSLDLRRAAADLAGKVPGVRGVANRIAAPGAPRPDRPINLKNNGEENDQVP